MSNPACIPLPLSFLRSIPPPFQKRYLQTIKHNPQPRKPETLKRQRRASLKKRSGLLPQENAIKRITVNCFPFLAQSRSTSAHVQLYSQSQYVTIPNPNHYYPSRSKIANAIEKVLEKDKIRKTFEKGAQYSTKWDDHGFSITLGGKHESKAKDRDNLKVLL